MPARCSRRRSTRQVLARPSRAECSCSRFLRRVENSYAAEPRRRAAVTHGCGLSRLTLAAVERTTQHVGLRSADRVHRAPEVGGRGLVSNVTQLTREPAGLDAVEPLTGELEVVALHVD